MRFAPGARLGPYEILTPLGAGGMGELYRARDPRLSREVAIKVLPQEYTNNPRRLARFEREARSASALNHPNIVTIYEVGEVDSTTFLVMELIEGKTLREVLFPGPLTVERAIHIAAQIAAGLTKAHEAGIVNRDLKPENLMITRDGLIKILDFGLATLADSANGDGEDRHLPTITDTISGAVVGTLAYMSPEQASGHRVDFRSDQFALGAILYEMIAGKRAFAGKTAPETLAAVLRAKPEPIGVSIPPALSRLLDRCLAKEPDERYASTRDLARDLDSLMAWTDHPDDSSSAGRRLDSWKEIASYLKRSVRSVQRWEAEEGMPVHRHLHDKRGSVYAFAEELDSWWKERGAMLAQRSGASERKPAAEEPAEARPVESVPSRPHKSRRLVWAVAGFAAALLTVSILALLSRDSSSAPSGSLRPLPFKARDWVLVASFENRTGEKLFDGTLDYALGRELSSSRHVSVVSRDRVDDALRLMRKPLDTPLDASLAREVCLRDGEIRALLTGRVEKLGSRYVFGVELVEPRQGATLAAFGEESTGTEGALAAMERIANRVRATLGEVRTENSGNRGDLAKVTTSSLRALQLYSQADRLIGESDAGAEELLRQAVAEDPNFASAYIHLAHAVNNQGRPPKDYVPYAQTAFRLSDTTTERERYFIRGSYYHLLGEREKAIAAYEALLAMYPDHPWATGNLLTLYDRWKDFDRILEAEIREADARPGFFNLNFHAAYNIIRWKRQPTSRAEPYLRRARELLSPEVAEQFPSEAAWLESLPFTERLATGDVENAIRELDRLAAKVDSLAGTFRDTLAAESSDAYLTLGRLRAAERVATKIRDPAMQRDALAQVYFARGDRVELVRHLRMVQPTDYASWTLIPIQTARSGLVREARGWLPAMEKGARKRGWADRRETLLGEIALAQGNLDEAIRRFEAAARLRDKRFDPRGSLLAAESFAAALKRQGQIKRAIEVLEPWQGEFRPFVIAGPYWQKNRLDLAKLYRSVGRVQEARAIEAELLERLALADDDHPILIELRRLPGASPT